LAEQEKKKSEIQKQIETGKSFYLSSRFDEAIKSFLEALAPIKDVSLALTSSELPEELLRL